MSRIVFFARDPGGASALVPLVRRFNDDVPKRIIEVYSKDYAYEMFKKFAVKSVRVTSANEIKSLPMTGVLVTGTSYRNNSESLLWKDARQKGVPSVGFLDHWMGYDRFYRPEEGRSCYPEHLCVIDELCRDSFMKTNRNAETKIHVVGQPYFDIVREQKRSEVEVKTFRNRFFDGYDRVYLYGAEKIKGYRTENKYGYNEFSQFGFLADILATRSEKAKVVFRPHPKHEKSAVKRELKKMGAVVNKRVEVEVNDTYDQYLLMQAADCVFGINSMILVEAWLLESRVCSLCSGALGHSDFDLLTRGIIPSVQKASELHSLLEGEYETGKYDKKALEGCTDRACAVIESLLV